MADISKTIAEFEKTRSQLMGMSAQKNQLQVQSELLAKSVEELKNTKEEKVYKAAGNIMILTSRDSALKDVESQKESVDLRYKTVDRQETNLIDKLNKLKMEIEKSQGKKTIVSTMYDSQPDTSAVM